MDSEPLPRSYGCTFGCGNPYDYVIVTVQDSTTEMLCLPCFLKLASDVLEAVVNPDNPDVIRAIENAGTAEQTKMNGQGPKRGRKNAPVTADDPSLIEAFDSVISEDELPPEFR